MTDVSIEQGIVRGLFRDGCYQFLGIPYAAPPVGALRWRSPMPPAAWTGIREATSFGNAAIQAADTGLELGAEPSEDCLYLNVWTNAVGTDTLQPVMVWIHGGGFLNGSSSMKKWTGESLAQKDVVVVSMNYRLGALGFLSHPDAGGNFGVQDWIAALTWVSKNIRTFGGDPSKVTVFGQSSGGAAVRALLSAPAAHSLFHRAIIQSAGYEPYAVVSTPSLKRVSEASQIVFDLLGTEDLDLLRQLPAEQIRQAALKANGTKPPPGQLHTPANLQWYPVPDGKAITDGFDGWPEIVPVMFGCTSDEMRGFYRPNGLYGRPEMVPAEVYTQATLKQMARALAGEKADDILAHYAKTDMTPYASLAHLGSVAIWTEPALATYNRFARLQRTAYFYKFGRVSPAARRSHLLGYHSSEIPYIFGPMTRHTKWDPLGDPKGVSMTVPMETPVDRDFDITDVQIAQAMQEAWVEFARTGTPSSKGQAWPACTESNPRYTLIRDEVEVKRLEIDPVEAMINSTRI